jgi:hypothetical protein
MRQCANTPMRNTPTRQYANTPMRQQPSPLILASASISLTMRNIVILIFFSVLVFYTLFELSCGNESVEKKSERLARAYCGSCHIFPEPELLDKKTWTQDVLPRMGWYFGIRSENHNPYRAMSREDLQIISEAGIFPGTPVLDEETWDNIVSFYERLAPENLLMNVDKSELLDGGELFVPIPVTLGLREGPMTTMVKWDALNRKIWLSDLRDTLYYIDPLGEIVSKENPGSLLSDVEISSDGAPLALAMGYLHPRDQPLGQLLQLYPGGVLDTLIEPLARPVDMELADLNQDGREDIVICNFGNHVGRLSWYEQTADRTYREHVLLNSPGAVKCYVEDLNRDGLPDIISLMGQGDEGFFISYNQGGGVFRTEQVIRFPPVYGSSHFELLDYDEDGDWDILYSNGDNADYSHIPKPYHGVRLFLNDGGNKFEEAFFFPMYGATKALARDFDGDGDLDIVAIAFFAEYNLAPRESFVYLENIDPNQFQFRPYGFDFSHDGRWLVMDSGDIDGDGTEDVIIGSLHYAPTPVPGDLKQKWVQEGPNALILLNNFQNRE